MAQAVYIDKLRHQYADRVAVEELSLSVAPSEIFGLCGPNGGGKSTTFKIISTLIKPSAGRVEIFGVDAVANPMRARNQLGVVFQSASVDKKLTVRENLSAQGSLYGLSGRALADRVDYVLTRLNLADRANDYAEKLSGGLRRRVEVAKGILHKPKLLILDEPTTGLDPLVRRELWDHLEWMRNHDGMTILVTTHLLEEAERCDKLAFLHEGRLVALGSPRELREELSGEMISIRAAEPNELLAKLRAKYGDVSLVTGGEIRLNRPGAHLLVGEIMNDLGPNIDSITLGRPTLEDVFIAKTGYQFREGVARV